MCNGSHSLPSALELFTESALCEHWFQTSSCSKCFAGLNQWPQMFCDQDHLCSHSIRWESAADACGDQSWNIGLLSVWTLNLWVEQGSGSLASTSFYMGPFTRMMGCFLTLWRGHSSRFYFIGPLAILKVSAASSCSGAASSPKSSAFSHFHAPCSSLNVLQDLCSVLLRKVSAAQSVAKPSMRAHHEKRHAAKRICAAQVALAPYSHRPIPSLKAMHVMQEHSLNGYDICIRTVSYVSYWWLLWCWKGLIGVKLRQSQLKSVSEKWLSRYLLAYLTEDTGVRWTLECFIFEALNPCMPIFSIVGALSLPC